MKKTLAAAALLSAIALAPPPALAQYEGLIAAPSDTPKTSSSRAQTQGGGYEGVTGWSSDAGGNAYTAGEGGAYLAAPSTRQELRSQDAEKRRAAAAAERDAYIQRKQAEYAAGAQERDQRRKMKAEERELQKQLRAERQKSEREAVKGSDLYLAGEDTAAKKPAKPVSTTGGYSGVIAPTPSSKR